MQTRKNIGLAGLIALGLTAAAPGVHAQASSNTTVYGIIDVGVEAINGIAANGSDKSLVRLSPSSQTASRWGVRGSEDLGGGLKAVFNLENGFDPDTGVILQNGRLFGRAAFVGIEGASSGLTLGRQRNAIFDLSLNYDPLAYATYGILAFDSAIFLGRVDNSAKYTFKQGGLSSSLLYSLGRDGLAGTPAGSQSEVPGQPKIGRQVGANVDYAAGPFRIGLGYDQQHGSTVALQSETDTRVFLAASYQLAKAKLFAGYQRRNNDIPAVDQRTDLYWVGARQPITQQLGIAASVVQSKLKNSPNKATLLGASLTYDFSKRTQWYLNAGYANNGGASTQGVTSGTPTIAGKNQTGIASGIVHRF